LQPAYGIAHKVFRLSKQAISSRRFVRDCLRDTFAIFGGVSVFSTVIGFSLYSYLDESVDWLFRFGIMLVVSVVVFVTVFFIKLYRIHVQGVTLRITNKPIYIKKGNIFHENGVKVIHFNTCYDTKIDESRVISNSITGSFIKLISEQGKIRALNAAIKKDRKSKLQVINTGDGNEIYESGNIKVFEDYLLLAFAHLNDKDEAHFSWSSYEKCLRNMWSEIDRTHQNRAVSLPLLGGGSTRLTPKTEHENLDLLKTMIHTYKTTDVRLNQPITIVLSEEAMQEINIYNLKGEL